jgi:hypothetical protein
MRDRFLSENNSDPELVLPMSLFGALVSMPYFVCVLPFSSPEAYFADFHRIVKVAGIDDRVWHAEGGRPPSERSSAHIFYDVQQIRECLVRHVAKSEWDRNLGPNSLGSWVNYRKMGPNTPVRVFHMKKVTYNLRDFNKEYGWRFK